MDPYLEHPVYFPGLHDRLIATLSEVLQPLLPEPYYAEIASRVWLEVAQRPVGPNVNVLRAERPSSPAPPDGGVAVAVQVHTKPVVVRVPHIECKDTRVDLYTRANGEERLVTTIEILSPSNKTPGEHGRDLYLRKQREVLDSGSAHLVEIDLLRAGQHTTAVPLDRARALTGPFDYHVCIHHFDNLEDYFVYPVLLQERLPPIAVPLLPGDPPVTVDLQALLDRCYDAGPYRRRVRYAELTPQPPLRPEQAEWANRLLRERGVIPAP
jgi:hypothetical protein